MFKKENKKEIGQVKETEGDETGINTSQKIKKAKTKTNESGGLNNNKNNINKNALNATKSLSKKFNNVKK